jgi:hypothetical protein
MYLHDLDEQDAAVQFLEAMNKTMGWKTSQIVQDLRKQWQS